MQFWKSRLRGSVLNMKKTPHPQNQKYLCADAESEMASALDFMHAEVNEIVGSAPIALRGAFADDILGRVAKDLRVCQPLHLKDGKRHSVWCGNDM